jgi:hypothetical protein
MTTEPKKKQMSSAMAIAIIALGLSITAFVSSYPVNSNDLQADVDQLKTNMTQFSNFTKNQGTFNLQVINWATNTEQKIDFLVNQTLQDQK